MLLVLHLLYYLNGLLADPPPPPPPFQLLGNEASRLISEQPSSQELIDEKQSEMLDNWTQLTERADTRKANLLQSRELQKFLADLKDLVGVVLVGVALEDHLVCKYCIDWLLVGACLWTR